jgi:hypothetical protein
MCQGRTLRFKLKYNLCIKINIILYLLGIYLLLSGCVQQTEPPIQEKLNDVDTQEPIEEGGIIQKPATVGKINQAPEIFSLPITTINIDEGYFYHPQAIDTDGDKLNWELINPPQGLNIDVQTGVIYSSQLPVGNYMLNIRVNDGKGGSADQSFTLNIKNNPSIYSIAPIYTFTGSPYKYQVAATTPDKTTLIHALETGPSGMLIDPDSGSLSWNNPAVGEYNVIINVTSTSGNFARQEYILNVLDSNNLFIISKPETVGFVSQTYDYKISVLSSPEKDKTYTLFNGVSGMSVDASSGLLTWIPDAAGIYSIEITVMDTDGRTGSQSFDLQIHSLEEMDQIFNEVLENVFDNLNTGDINNARLFLSGEAQVKYLPVLNELLPFMEDITDNLGSLERMSIDNQSAEYIIPRTLKGEARLFIVTFVPDAEGNWKLNSL